MAANFGAVLKQWRSIRRYSQLDLSLAAEISSRHVSFLESGRARPSREMVIKLADALQMPKEAANMAMHAAGFAAVFPELELDDEALKPVRAAISQLIARHAPLPAVAIDRYWDVIEANAGAQTLFSMLGIDGAANMIDAILAAGETDFIENWEETALLALSRLRVEIIQLGGDTTLERYAKQIAAHKRLEKFDAGKINFNQVIIPTVFALPGARLSMFSTIAHFGAVQDVAASDIRVEMMFPADEASARYFDILMN